jgi:DNA-binding phage protein
MSKLPNQDINSAKDTISNALIREALSVAASRGLNIVNIANKAGISAELLLQPKHESLLTNLHSFGLNWQKYE